MSTRLKKEFRVIFPAWCVVAALTVLIPFRWLLPLGSEFNQAITELAPTILAVSFCLAAAMSYSSEFHFRTLNLLMAQPASRASIWNVKHLTVAGSLLPLMFVYLVLKHLSLQQFSTVMIPEVRSLLIREQPVLWLAFLLCTFCSAGFWALVARNLIGAVVLNVGTQMLFLLGVSSVLKILRASTGLFGGSPQFAHLIIAALVYSGVFAWLGFRRFKKLEIVDASSETTASQRFLKVVTIQNSTATSVPRKAWQMLLDKELRLQRPTLLVAIAFAFLWVATFLLFKVLPLETEDLKNALGLMTAFYIPLAMILSGCISISEENRIGLFEWHMTFPVSLRKTWSLRLITGFAAGISAGIVLPAVMAVATGLLEGKGLPSSSHIRDLAVLALFVSFVFLVSSWVSSFLRDIVRAALGTVLVSVITMLLAGFTAWLTSGPGGLQTYLLSWVVAELQISFAAAEEKVPYIFTCGLTLVMGTVLLWQNYRAQRLNQSGFAPFLRSFALIAAVFLLMAIWAFDLVKSSFAARYSVFYKDINRAIAVLPEGPRLGETKQIGVTKLEETGQLSRFTKRWLRGSKLTMIPTKNRHRDSVQLQVVLPTGQGEIIQAFATNDQGTETD